MNGDTSATLTPTGLDETNPDRWDEDCKRSHSAKYRGLGRPHDDLIPVLKPDFSHRQLVAVLPHARKAPL